MNYLLSIFAFLLLLTPALGSRAPESTISQDELVRTTQELFDAVAPGNPEPFKKYFAEDAMFFDEKGRSMDKAALVKDVQPLPKGYSGTIKLVRPKSHIEGNVAILSYDLDETETVFGQKHDGALPRNRYLDAARRKMADRGRRRCCATTKIPHRARPTRASSRLMSGRTNWGRNAR